MAIDVLQMARRVSPAAMTGWPATQKASARMRWLRLNELRQARQDYCGSVNTVSWPPRAV